MTLVSAEEGVRYGFQLLGYLLAVGIGGGIIVVIGGAMSENSPILGGIIAFAGVLVIYAGGLGLLYKVIADGVKTGVEGANGSTIQN